MAGPLYGDPVDRGHPLARGLLLWWAQFPGRGAAGTLFDAAAGHHPGTTTAGTPIPGPGFLGIGATDYNGSSAYTRADAVPLTGVPVTMACWVYPDSTATLQTVLGLASSASTHHYHILQLRGGSGNTVAAASQAGAGGAVLSATTATYSTGTWQHIAAVFASATSRVAYLNGVAATPETTSRAPTGIDRFAAGRFDGTTGSGYYDGRIADVRVYDRALADDEVRLLYEEGRRGLPRLTRQVPRRAWLTGVPTAPGGFQAAWARGANVLIGAGRA